MPCVREVIGSIFFSSAEAPYGKFLNNGGRAGNDGKRERARANPFKTSFKTRILGADQKERGFWGRECLSPGPRPAATTARKRPLRRREGSIPVLSGTQIFSLSHARVRLISSLITFRVLIRRKYVRRCVV